MLCYPDPELILVRTDLAVALQFPHAIKPGHIVVGCRSHIRKIEDVPDAEYDATARLLRDLAGRLNPILHPERYYVAIVGDRDRHFHFHLLPKMAADPMLGSHVFGEGGWASRVHAADTHGVEEAIRKALRDWQDSVP